MKKFKEDIDRIQKQDLTHEEYLDAVAGAQESFEKRLYGILDTPLTEEDLTDAEKEYLNLLNNNLE